MTGPQMNAAYDAAVAQESGQDSISRDRLEFQREKFGAEMAFKEAQAQSAAERAADLVRVANERNQATDQRITLAEAEARLNQKAQELKEQTAMRTLQQGEAFLNDAKYMDPDKPEFDQQLRNMMAGYPAALEHPTVKQWFTYSTERNKAARERQAAMGAAAGLPVKRVSVDGVTYENDQKPVDQGTVTTKTGDDGKVSTSVTRPYSPEAEQQNERAKTIGEHNALEASINAKAAKMFGGASTDEIAQLNTLKAKLGYQQIDASGKPIGQAPIATTAADPRTALAKKALNDPNASEAHKAAARRILGVQ